MHTVFAREHNRIEELLHSLNPDWSGEMLYQESRKIVGAILQVIAYREHLPAVIGQDMMDEYGLTLQTTGYDRSKAVSRRGRVAGGRWGAVIALY